MLALVTLAACDPLPSRAGGQSDDTVDRLRQYSEAHSENQLVQTSVAQSGASGEQRVRELSITVTEGGAEAVIETARKLASELGSSLFSENPDFDPFALPADAGAACAAVPGDKYAIGVVSPDANGFTVIYAYPCG